MESLDIEWFSPYRKKKNICALEFVCRPSGRHKHGKYEFE